MPTSLTEKSASVFLICGNRNTGKSLYYEKFLYHKKNKAYFATLWETEHTLQKIQTHKARRDDTWIIGESVGEVKKDEATLMGILSKSKMPLSFMIDGLTNWVLFCAKDSHDYIGEANRLINMLLTIINNYSYITSTEWYLLDNKRSDYSEFPILLESWDVLHSSLRANIRNLNIIDWDQFKSEM